jgi:hypothetical protein
VAERFADGKASKGELTRVWEAAGEVSPSGHGAAARHHRWHQAHTAAWRVAASAACNAARIVLPTYSTPGDPSPAKEIVLLRDLFGDLFRLFAINQRWLTSEVVAVANGIYDDRAFECLPVLADALEDAGCSDTDILSPLHSPDPHVRGCWALDLILGKQ